jgi:PKD repeat protein
MLSAAFRRALAVGAIAAIATTAACTVHDTETPPLAGPSGLALNLTVSALPDTINQDGGSQSAIKVTAIGPDGRGVSALAIRLDTRVNGVAQDFGTLSARTIVTGGDGTASVVFTAPPRPTNGVFGTCNGLAGNCVSIVATASGTNFETANPASVDIRLVPTGVILPPASNPTAVFSFSPNPASANVPVQFNAAASQAGSGASQISSFAWTFGDGSSGTGQTPTHTFGAGGTYSVSLTVTNDRGLSATSSQNVTVGNTTLPVASFTVSPQAPGVGQPVFFNGSGSTPGAGHQTITSYRWTFGDGGTGSGQTVSHSYSAAGNYVVQLTVVDDAGATATSNGTNVTVATASGGPVANFTFSPGTPAVGETVIFDWRTSTATQGAPIVSLDWNFGDASPAVHCPGDAVCGTDGITQHNFQRTGAFTVVLMVTDSVGRTSIKSNQVTVSQSGGTGGATTASFIFSPTNPSANQIIFFNAAGSTAAAGHTLTSYKWDFGDGSITNSTTPSTSHTFTAAGSYSVALTVTDDTNVQARVVVLISVASTGTAGPPSASFTFSPTAPAAGQSVFFNGSTSAASSGRTITSYDWTFGDGATGTGVTTSHAYSLAGTYAVQLKVTDDAGQSTTSSPTTITVGNPPAPTANFTFSPQSPSVAAGGNVVFDASSSTTAQGQTITTYRWNFGDSSAVVTCQTNSLAPCGGSAPHNGSNPWIVDHSYTTAGTYTVNLTVTDSAGRTNAINKQVTIVP